MKKQSNIPPPLEINRPKPSPAPPKKNHLPDSVVGAWVNGFIVHMQFENVWPCKLEIGEKPVPLTPEELFRMRDDFKKKMDK